MELAIRVRRALGRALRRLTGRRQGNPAAAEISYPVYSGMTFVQKGHLGGYVRRDPISLPNGDPMSFTPELWEWLRDRYRPASVCDVGCGEGHAVKHFIERGVRAVGVDGFVEVLRTAVVPPEAILIHDFSTGPISLDRLPEPPELVFSCEFVEHVDAAFMENYLRLFDLARVVCFTHAFPGQEGHHHVNCQSPAYWKSVMEARGYRCDEDASEESRLVAGESHWRRSGLIFLRRSSDSAVRAT